MKTINGKDLVIAAIKLNDTVRIPWVPFVGVHAASLIGVSASDYLKSTELIVKGVGEAIRLYQPDGIPVAFDLQVEAEALGCKLNWSEDNPPAVISHPLLESPSAFSWKVPSADSGRIPVMIQAAEKLRSLHPDIALYGLVTGPFTLSLHLMGTDVFMKMFEDPDYLHKVMDFSAEVSMKMASLYLEAGCDVIAMVDPMTSQIDPESFRSFVSPYASRIFRFIEEKKTCSSFFVCGNAMQNIEEMCLCGPDNISIDENIPLDYVRDIALSHNISFGGNIKLTVSLLMGTPEDVMRDALECMDTGGNKGFILAPGCDLAMATPQENLLAITRLVNDSNLQGELRASTAASSGIEPLDLSNHWMEGKLIIDIVTLDSSSCAPCQYMVDAVARAVEPFGEKVVYKEHRIKEMDGVRMMKSLGVQSIPSIVMNGNVEFASRIPPIELLRERIGKHLEKMHD